MTSPTATAEPPAPAAPSRTAREFAQFVTDAQWNVQHARVEGTETLWGSNAQLVGGNLRERVGNLTRHRRGLLYRDSDTGGGLYNARA